LADKVKLLNVPLFDAVFVRTLILFGEPGTIETPYVVASAASEMLYVSPQRPAILYAVATESEKFVNEVRTAVAPKLKLIVPIVWAVVIVVCLHGCSSVKLNV